VARPEHLLAEIEASALDSSISLGDVLRKVVALGGRAGSPELREWATKELHGYGPGDELPDYRKIQAPLQLDAALPFGGQVRGQPISTLELPDFARDAMSEPILLLQGVVELEKMAGDGDDSHLKLQDGRMQDLVACMNASGNYVGHVMS
jgi:hypothetical protein